jgi:hypothetical protein
MVFSALNLLSRWFFRDHMHSSSRALLNVIADVLPDWLHVENASHPPLTHWACWQWNFWCWIFCGDMLLATHTALYFSLCCNGSVLLFYLITAALQKDVILHQSLPKYPWRFSMASNILYHFDQFNTPLWQWHIGSIRHFDTSSWWPWQSQNFDTQ